MTKGKETLISCIKCNEPLVYEELEISIGICIDLPYCPNVICTRYKLYTSEPDND